MAINAKSGGSTRELIEANNYLARCVSMVHIGTIEDSYMGELKIVNKVRLTWELPTELRVFNEDKGEQPMVIDKEYTVSLSDKANLTTDLNNWRGKSFTEEEKEGFDILVLVSIPCMLNIIHKTSAKGKVYATVGSIAPVPKGIPIPPQMSTSIIFDYDEHFNLELLKTFPDFIKDKIMISEEYKLRTDQMEGAEQEKKEVANPPEDDLPF